MHGVTAWLFKNWFPIAGIAALLFAADVLRNPIADLQGQINDQKISIEKVNGDVAGVKAGQPTPREIKEEDQFRSDVRETLKQLQKDVWFIKGRIASQNAGAFEGEAFDPSTAATAGDVR